MTLTHQWVFVPEPTRDKLSDATTVCLATFFCNALFDWADICDCHAKPGICTLVTLSAFLWWQQRRRSEANNRRRPSKMYWFSYAVVALETIEKFPRPHFAISLFMERLEDSHWKINGSNVRHNYEHTGDGGQGHCRSGGESAELRMGKSISLMHSLARNSLWLTTFLSSRTVENWDMEPCMASPW